MNPIKRRTIEPRARPAVRTVAATLSRREREIIDRAALGGTNKEIAHALGIEPGTVALHLSRIYRKLGVANRVQAVRLALGITTGDTDPDDDAR